MRLKHNCILIAFLYCWSNLLSGLPVFTNKTSTFKKNIATRSVQPGGVMDIDGDLVDDLVILDKGTMLKTVKSHGKYFKLALLDSIKTVPTTEWTLTAGDINNDGKLEVITAGEYNLASMVTLDRQKLTKKSLYTGVYAQGSNTADINQDGWLDYFVCNDAGPNLIYMNDGAGNLQRAELIDFMKNDPSDGSGNYNSEWIDVNGDFLPDLSIAKCRAGVDNPSDPRRVNRLYINQGNNKFEDMAPAFGMNSGAQSWVTAFGDLDNDGDQDALIVNHYSPHQLMENIGSTHFVNRPLPENHASFSFQAVVRDFDNDGWLDIMLAGVEGSALLHNKKNMTFELYKYIIGPAQPRSITCGDFNDDGYPDIHAHMALPINEVGELDDQLWLNDGGKNQYIKFNLQGNTSNKSAIGTHLTLYGSWGKQIRYVKGGESYGIFNSLQQIFGIGNATEADSIVIHWPSGKIEKYNQLIAGKTYYIQEGKCMTAQVELFQDQLIVKDSNLTISAPSGWPFYLWSTGNTSASISLPDGSYHVSMTDHAGCTTISKPISLISGCFPADVDLLPYGEEIKSCTGDIVTIQASTAATYFWSDGRTTSDYTSDESGWISLIATDYCGNTTSDSLYMSYHSVEIQVAGDTIMQGNRATLISNNPTTQWFTEDNIKDPIFVGDTLITEPLEKTTIFKANAIEVIDKKIANVGETIFPSSNFYGANTTTGAILFKVERPCIIHSFTVNTDTEGDRLIIILNDKKEVIFSKKVSLIVGFNKIVMDAKMEIGSYSISTDESVNEASLGYKSPRLVRSATNVKYPYELANVITLLSSSFGAGYYMYFYDWEIHYDITSCESELLDVIALVEPSGTHDINDNQITIYPNPTEDILNIKANFQIEDIEIRTVNNQNLMVKHTNQLAINISNLPSGLYIISIKTDKGWIHKRWAKM
ncbi:MAG: VCBS repeat-containing protein [Saprospiraceae bacterium]|nr:VCBS repeat-containing protein [Saprospiraceae bacterium]